MKPQLFSFIYVMYWDSLKPIFFNLKTSNPLKKIKGPYYIDLSVEFHVFNNTSQKWQHFYDMLVSYIITSTTALVMYYPHSVTNQKDKCWSVDSNAHLLWNSDKDRLIYMHTTTQK